MGSSNIFEKALAFNISVGRVGTKRKVSTVSMKQADENAADFDPRAVSITKEIIDCPELKQIKTLDAAIKKTLSSVALPSPLKSSMYLIPVVSIEDIDANVETYKAKREQAITAFSYAYSTAQEAAKTRLGGLYDGSDYPPLAKVLGSFYVETSYMELGTPGSLKKLAPQIFQKEQAAFEQRLQSAENEIREALRLTFSELIEHMYEKLTPAEDGKPKIFRDTLVSNLTGFLATFQKRNLVEDNELSALVDKAREALGNRTADDLRKPMFAGDMRARLDDIKATLATMITAKPTRSFDLDE